MEEVIKPGKEWPPLTPPAGGGQEEPIIISLGAEVTVSFAPLYIYVSSDIAEQVMGWGLLHADVGEEFLSSIFQRGPKDIDRIVDDQETVVAMLTHIYNNRWILLVVALYVE